MRERREFKSKRIVLLTTVSVFLMIVGVVESRHFHASRPNPLSQRKDEALKKFKGMPLYFEKNLGQSDPSVRFLSHSSRSSLFLTDDAAVITMVGGAIHKSAAIQSRVATTDKLVESAVRIRLVGANQHPQFEALDPLPGSVNYIIGNESSKYHRDVPIFGRVRMKNVYPGVDLVYYGTPQTLEYDLIVAPGADTSKLKFAVEGGSKASVDPNGNLVIVTAAGSVVLRKPLVSEQDARGTRTPIAGAFKMMDDGAIEGGIARHEVSFDIAAYDHRQTLTVDPPVNILVYSTYLGGRGANTGSFSQQELSALAGEIGLNTADMGTALAVDSSNHAYVTGLAFSTDFPTSSSAFQTTNNGATHQNPNAFISKFDYSMTGSSSLIFSTYVGGSGSTAFFDEGMGDIANGIAVDASGNSFIVGQTFSNNFPEASDCAAFGQTYPGGDFGSGFVAKLDAGGGILDYSCYIGANATSGNFVAAMETGVALQNPACGNSPAPTCNVFIVGTTSADSTSGYPVSSNAFQIIFPTNSSTDFPADGAATFFVLSDNQPDPDPVAPTMTYSTLYGGSGNSDGASDFGVAVTSDPIGGNGFITGATYSSDLSVPGAQVSAYNSNAASNGTSNVFVAEFNPTALTGLASLVYGTYLGGSGAVPAGNPPIGDVGTAIAFDGRNSTIWVTGYTASTDFLVPSGTSQSVPSFQTANNAAAAGAPATNAFITHLSPTTATASGVLYQTMRWKRNLRDRIQQDRRLRRRWHQHRSFWRQCLRHRLYHLRRK